MSANVFAQTPQPPYYAVIFSSQRQLGVADDYDAVAQRMLELAKEQPGFLGVDSSRDEKGFGITVSYWSDESSIRAWRNHLEHAAARERGRLEWYSHYQLRVAKVERAYGKSAAESL